MGNSNTLWIDGVGGYLVCCHDEVVFGGRGCDRDTVEISSELRKRAISIWYAGDEYLVRAISTVAVALNGKTQNQAFRIQHGDIIQVGESVTIRFSKPNPLSDTAVLELTSRHRWKDAVDGVVLFRGVCVLGAKIDSHVVCKNWNQNVLLFRQADQWNYRLQVANVFGRQESIPFLDHSSFRQNKSPVLPLKLGERICGNDYSLTIL